MQIQIWMAPEVHSPPSLPPFLHLFEERAQQVRVHQRTGSDELPRNQGSHFHQPEVPTATESPRGSSKDVGHYGVRFVSWRHCQDTSQAGCTSLSTSLQDESRGNHMCSAISLLVHWSPVDTR